jgi:hypothetical protein
VSRAMALPTPPPAGSSDGRRAIDASTRQSLGIRATDRLSPETPGSRAEGCGCIPRRERGPCELDPRARGWEDWLRGKVGTGYEQRERRMRRTLGGLLYKAARSCQRFSLFFAGIAALAFVVSLAMLIFNRRHGAAHYGDFTVRRWLWICPAMAVGFWLVGFRWLPAILGYIAAVAGRRAISAFGGCFGQPGNW